MRPKFSLYQSHLDFAHLLWSRLIQPGDWAIDATCGNGLDSQTLVRLPLAGLVCMDIQEKAIEKTKKILESSGTAAKLHFHLGCHSIFPEMACQLPIRLIVYNLGYLPGGDKQITTLSETTLKSIKNARILLLSGGMISITCYPGHSQGFDEKKALLEELSHPDPDEWSVSHHEVINRSLSPSVLILQKNRNLSRELKI